MKRVVITGGGGYLAGLLSEHLSAQGYEPVLVGRTPRPGRTVVLADLSSLDPNWTSLLDGAFAVVHLAAVRQQGADWSSIQANNIDATFNVLEAAARARVRRVVIGSSSRVLGGYFHTASKMTPETPPKPTGPYAQSKLVGELAGRNYARLRGLSVICIRIGRCHKGEERFSGDMPLINQYRWLSPHDFCHGLERAVAAEDVDFALLHLASKITDSPWDTSDTQKIIGFTPNDVCHPVLPSFRNRLARALVRRIRRDA